MRRAISLLLVSAVVAALGVATARAASARASLGATTTGTATTTTSPTTTAITTTTTTAPTTTTPAATTTAPTTTSLTVPTTTTTATSPQPVANRESARVDKKAEADSSHAKKHRRRQPMRPPPAFPSSPYPFRVAGGLTAAAQDDPVVAVAMQYLGVPYKWGGASPKAGFDCSGLVKYVFAQLGLSLPHYAAAQWYFPGAVWVPPERLQPGDLVFFTGSDGTREAPGHVGIYVGDGYLIDAPHTGSFVRFDSLEERWFANKYVGAKRIVGTSLDARRLFEASKTGAFAMAGRAGFPRPITIEPAGESVRVAAIGTAGARAAPRDYTFWAAVVLGALLLLFSVGGLTLRRRRRSGNRACSP
jgi:cell wall-associated NlpC family hydrolase